MQHFLRLIGALTILALTATVFSVAASAQTYGGDLPPGVEAVTIGGADIDSEEVPVLDTTTPTFSGALTPGPTEAEFTVLSEPIVWTVPIDPITGEFSTVAPFQITPGTHSLYIDDALIGQFIIAAGAEASVPGVPLQTEGDGPVTDQPGGGDAVDQPGGDLLAGDEGGTTDESTSGGSAAVESLPNTGANGFAAERQPGHGLLIGLLGLAAVSIALAFTRPGRPMIRNSTWS